MWHIVAMISGVECGVIYGERTNFYTASDAYRTLAELVSRKELPEPGEVTQYQVVLHEDLVLPNMGDIHTPEDMERFLDRTVSKECLRATALYNGRLSDTYQV